MKTITVEQLALREARDQLLGDIDTLADRLAVQNARLRRERDEARAALRITDEQVEAACERYYRHGQGWENIEEGSEYSSAPCRSSIRVTMREALRAALAKGE